MSVLLGGEGRHHRYLRDTRRWIDDRRELFPTIAPSGRPVDWRLPASIRMIAGAPLRVDGLGLRWAGSGGPSLGFCPRAPHPRGLPNAWGRLGPAARLAHDSREPWWAHRRHRIEKDAIPGERRCLRVSLGRLFRPSCSYGHRFAQGEPLVMRMSRREFTFGSRNLRHNLALGATSPPATLLRIVHGGAADA